MTAKRAKPAEPEVSDNGGPPRRTFREFQFVVVPVLLIEEEGRSPYPGTGEQVICNGLAELQALVDRFAHDLEVLNRQAADGQL